MVLWRVVLTQISLDITHKNLAVHKEAGLGPNTLQTTPSWGKRSRKAREYCERKVRIVLRTIYFAESFDEPGGKSAFEMHHSFLYLNGSGQQAR